MLSKAQKKVLKLMAQGWELGVGEWTSIRNNQSGEYQKIRYSTYLALSKGGWIKEDYSKHSLARIYILTPAGRMALEAEGK